MKTRDLLRLVWGNLRRMKARVAMTAVGVVIGTAAVIVLISLAAGLQRTASEDLASIGDLTRITVYSPSFIRYMGGAAGQTRDQDVLDDRMLEEFRDLPGVVAATPQEQLMGAATLRLNRLLGGAQVVGIDPTQASGLGFELASGMDRLGRWQVLAGARLAEQFYDPQSQRPVRDPPDLQGQGVQLVLNKMGDDGNSIERVVRLRVTGVMEESGGRDD